jgi:2-polyprenyl-6-methoxyphenol hydroxylase-like FAD-dependent oxidoreductase
MYQFKFVGGKRTDLNTEPFMRMDYATVCTMATSIEFTNCDAIVLYHKTEGGTGHVGFICHKQPELEKYLRAAMHATQYSQLRPSSTVTKISEDENWVYCHYLSANGKARRVRSKFLVGADGKTGFTRKHYLEAKGVRMEKVHK